MDALTFVLVAVVSAVVVVAIVAGVMLILLATAGAACAAGAAWAIDEVRCRSHPEQPVPVRQLTETHPAHGLEPDAVEVVTIVREVWRGET